MSTYDERHPAVIKSKDRPYAAMRFWLYTSGSFEYYVRQQVEGARAEHAPADALYKSETGEWRTVRDLEPNHPFRRSLADAGINPTREEHNA